MNLIEDEYILNQNEIKVKILSLKKYKYKCSF